MRLAGWFRRMGISGGLRPPLAPVLNIALRFRVLSTAPKGSRLLSCLPPAECTHEGLVFFNALARVFPRMCFFVPISRLPRSFSYILWLLMGYPLLAILYHDRGAAWRGYAVGRAAAMQSLPPTKSCFSLSFVYIPPASFQSREQQSYLHQFELIFQLSCYITSTPFPVPFALLFYFFFLKKGLIFLDKISFL